ncbi:MAG: CHAT domain-containing protein [Ardenticatenaceae bacterium]
MMSPGHYTYHIRIANRKSVQVEKRDPHNKVLGEPAGYFGYRGKCKKRIQTLHEAARSSTLDKRGARELGETLFTTVLDEQLRLHFFSLYEEAHREGRALRVELDIDERQLPDVAALPWEFMRVPFQEGVGTLWLATAPHLVFSRRRARWIAPQPIQLAPGERLRIALVVSAPDGLGVVRYEKIWHALQTLASKEPHFELLEIINPATTASIDAVLEEKPHLFHFIGHAKFECEAEQESGQIALVDDIFNDALWIGAERFSELFTRHQPGVVLLQACEGGALSASHAFVGVASQVVQQNIPVVVAMQYEVSNVTAQRFALEFYKRLAQNKPVDKAAQEGRRRIALGPLGYSKRDFATPVLFMRVPDGHLFQRAASSERVQTYSDQAKVSLAKPPLPMQAERVATGALPTTPAFSMRTERGSPHAAQAEFGASRGGIQRVGSGALPTTPAFSMRGETGAAPHAAQAEFGASRGATQRVATGPLPTTPAFSMRSEGGSPHAAQAAARGGTQRVGSRSLPTTPAFSMRSEAGAGPHAAQAEFGAVRGGTQRVATAPLGTTPAFSMRSEGGAERVATAPLSATPVVPVAASLIPSQFHSFIEDKTAGFVGREYVFATLDHFLSTQRSGYFTIEGRPGVGKSAILAEYVKRTECLAYFNMRSQGLNSTTQFLQNICSQLIVRYGLPYPSLPANATQDGAFFGQLLREATIRLAPQERLVIAIDALDEVDLMGHPRGVNILYLPPSLPERVYFIVTRPPVFVPWMVYAPHYLLDLMSYQVESQRDVQSYIKQATRDYRLRQWINRRQLMLSEFVHKLAEKSQNNFMYLRYILSDIQSGYYETSSLESLPTGLMGYYEDHWLRMGMNNMPLPRTKIKIIYLLAEVREPVSQSLIAEFAEVNQLTTQEVLNEWYPFLQEQRVEMQTRYSLYHSSFRDFLHRQDIIQAADVSIQGINALIANNLWGKLFGY